jgi:hypothetical protein
MQRTHIYISVKLLDGVILDKVNPNQVRLYHVIFLGKLVLAAVTQTNDVRPL